MAIIVSLVALATALLYARERRKRLAAESARERRDADLKDQAERLEAAAEGWRQRVRETTDWSDRLTGELADTRRELEVTRRDLETTQQHYTECSRARDEGQQWASAGRSEARALLKQIVADARKADELLA